MSSIQHIEDRKICLTRIFWKHGIEDIAVRAERLKFEGEPPDSALKFEEYKEFIEHEEGDVIDLQDFYEWTRSQATELEENGLFLTPSRPLTLDEYDKVGPALERFIRRSTSHGTAFDIQSDKDPDQSARIIYHLHMS